MAKPRPLSLMERLQRRLKSHGSLDRRHYAAPIAKDLLAMDSGKFLGTDESKAVSRWCLSTPYNRATGQVEQDRGHDVMEPSGCLPHIATYKANPVVLYDHETGLGPIGLAEDAAGRFTVRVESDGVYFDCHHTDLTEHARDIQALTMAKLLRACSPGFRPIKANRLDRGGHHFEEWELTECSITPIGENAWALQDGDAQTIRTQLDKNLVKSVRLRKLLEPYAAQPRGKSFSKGVTVDEQEKPEDKEEKLGMGDPDEDLKADPLPEEAEDENAGDDNLNLEKEEEVTPEDETPSASAMLAAKAYGMCKAVADGINEQLAPMGDMASDKHPVVKWVKGMLAHLEKALEDLGSHIPPDELEKMLATPTQDEGGLDEPVTKRRRRLVSKRLSKAHTATIGECKEWMDDVSDASDMPKRYRGGMKHYAKSLGDLLEGDKETERAVETKAEELPEEEEKKLSIVFAEAMKQLTA